MDERKNDYYNNRVHENGKRLAITALSAFIGAFLGSYFIVHQFLTREYPYHAPNFKGGCPFYNGMAQNGDDIFNPNPKKHHCKMKHKTPAQNTIYVIMGEEDIESFPFKVDEIKEKIMRLK